MSTLILIKGESQVIISTISTSITESYVDISKRKIQSRQFQWNKLRLVWIFSLKYVLQNIYSSLNSGPAKYISNSSSIFTGFVFSTLP